MYLKKTHRMIAYGVLKLALHRHYILPEGLRDLHDNSSRFLNKNKQTTINNNSFFLLLSSFKFSYSKRHITLLNDTAQSPPPIQLLLLVYNEQDDGDHTKPPRISASAGHDRGWQARERLPHWLLCCFAPRLLAAAALYRRRRRMSTHSNL